MFDPEKVLPLQQFSNHVIEAHREQWPIGEQELSKEFLAFFGITDCLGTSRLKKLSETLGEEPSFEKLPDDLHGANFIFAGKRNLGQTDDSNSDR